MAQWQRSRTPSAIWCFNKRARKGHDMNSFNFFKRRHVSTTVPAKGTTDVSAGNSHTPCFNYRAREGHDVVVGDTLMPETGFNYRAREGHDTAVVARRDLPDVSTTVPAKGTTFPLRILYGCRWFQLPCPRRARPVQFRPAAPTFCFNYRARGGHDASASPPATSGRCFNYRARGGHDIDG